MPKHNYCVYRHVTPNGKMYVGITGQQPERRWNNGDGYINNQYFTHAIKKYGWDNIKHEVLLTELTQDEAEFAEKLFIEYWNLTSRLHGYNLESGGHGGAQHSDETKHKISIATSGKNNPMYGKHHTNKTKRMISTSRKGKCCGESNPMYGKRHTDEAKRKMSEHHADFSGVNHPRYGLHCSEKSKRKMSKAKDKKKRPVVALNKQTKEQVFEFESMNEAARQLNIAVSHIWDCCQGKIKTSAGYIWKYKDMFPTEAKEK